MEQKKKKVIYIAGPITGVARYWEAFDELKEQAEALGCVALVPSVLPEGMTAAQYMRICFAMIDDADAVVLLPGWEHSEGAKLEKQYCDYINKPAIPLLPSELKPDPISPAWVAYRLAEVLR